jgi:N-methylhydantoinase A/oxoprolinase/acetone carboxylase beta subunit
MNGENLSVTVWRRSALPDRMLSGPLVIEEMSTTTIVPPGWSVHADAQGDLILERTGS